MFDIIKKQSSLLNETIFIKEFANGFKTYIIQKPNYKEKIGMLSVDFGSAYSEYKVSNNKSIIPYGTAHFLEHKLFDDKNINIIDAFSDNEGDANAYTTFSTTSYYFSSNNFFNENTKILFDFVTTPYFKNDKIEKEKGIIKQEINMYKDYPAWKVFLNLMDKLYSNKSFAINMAGREEDILLINEEILLEAYNHFYTPNNMNGIFVGDINVEEVFKMNHDYMNLEKKETPKIILLEEDNIVKENYVEDSMDIGNTIFNLGFKELPTKFSIAKKTICGKLLIDIIFGESSNFYIKMYNKGLIDNSFNGDYNNSKFFANIILAGSSKNPLELTKFILEEIQLIKKNSINMDRFLQIKKKHIGRLVMEFNNIENIANILQDCLSKGFDFIDLINELENIIIEDLNDYLNINFRKDNYVLSIINPK